MLEKNQERAVWLPQLIKHRIKLPLYFLKNPSYLKWSEENYEKDTHRVKNTETKMYIAKQWKAK